jgi:peptidylprolyl isomerase
MPKKSKRKHSRKLPPASRPAAAHKPAHATPPKTPPNIWQRMRKNWAATALVALGVLVVASMVLALAVPMLMSASPTPTPAPTPPPTAPPMTIDPTKAYTATVETTKGAIVIQLLPDAAPQTVNSFVFLARKGFYDGLTFHRVEDWVVQGGDPLGTGAGGPGYTVPAEFDSSKKYSQVRGTVGLARGQDPNSGGSQWYVVKQDATTLDGQYTTFGNVVSGMDVVDKLVIGDPMTKITITEGK